MPEYVRVKQAGTGHHLSVPIGHFKSAPEGAYQELKQDAVDSAGRPLPPKYHTSVASASEKKSTTPTGQKAETKEKD